MAKYVVAFVIVIAAVGAAVYGWDYLKKEPVAGNVEEQTARTLREAAPAVGARAACEAGCRNQYGGSGSAGFDACMRGCGAGGVLREAACPSPGPACPSPQSPVCHDGKWYCRLYSNDGAAAGARVFPETNIEWNYPTDVQLKEAACGEPALACEAPPIPNCHNGKWICGPATGVR